VEWLDSVQADTQTIMGHSIFYETKLNAKIFLSDFSDYK